MQSNFSREKHPKYLALLINDASLLIHASTGDRIILRKCSSSSSDPLDPLSLLPKCISHQQDLPAPKIIIHHEVELSHELYEIESRIIIIHYLKDEVESRALTIHHEIESRTIHTNDPTI
jgi:hypothetical protein